MITVDFEHQNGIYNEITASQVLKRQDLYPIILKGYK